VQFGENMAIPSFALYSLGGTVQYPLDIFGGLKRTAEEEQSLEDLERDELAAAYVMLTAQAVSQCITIAMTNEEMRAVDDIIASDEENLRLLDNAVQSGVLAGKGPEVLSAESQLASDRNLRPSLMQQLDMARHALTALTGRLPAQWSPPDFALSNMVLPASLPVSLPSAFVARRPDIRAADAQLHAASAAIGIAAANMLPNITLSGSWSYNALQLKDLFSPVGIVNSIGGQLAAPIFHGGTLEAQKKAAEAAYDAAQARYRKTVVQAFQQVADVLRALEHDAELTQSQQRSVAAATRSLEAARRNLSRGTNGYLQVLDATRQYNEALVGYVHAVSQRYQDTAQLFAALGGGWWHDPDFPAGHLTEDKTVAQRLPSVEVFEP
jgi:NodT family efflux transporter outer membrane factor (OMF) lipoprotein